MSKDFKIHIHGRCPACKEPYVNPQQFPYLLCRGFKVPLAIRHTFTPEPTARDKELIAAAHRKLTAAQKLDKAWPGAHITEQVDHMHFEFKIEPESGPIDTPLSDIQCALRAAGWELVDPTVEPDCVSGKLRELQPEATPQGTTQ